MKFCLKLVKSLNISKSCFTHWRTSELHNWGSSWPLRETLPAIVELMTAGMLSGDGPTPTLAALSCFSGKWNFYLFLFVPLVLFFSAFVCCAKIAMCCWWMWDMARLNTYVWHSAVCWCLMWLCLCFSGLMSKPLMALKLFLFVQQPWSLTINLVAHTAVAQSGDAHVWCMCSKVVSEWGLAMLLRGCF